MRGLQEAQADWPTVKYYCQYKLAWQDSTATGGNDGTRNICLVTLHRPGTQSAHMFQQHY
jgi:hypothetical protein